MEKINYIILEQIINEGRLEDAIKKYSGTDHDLTDDTIRELSNADPSGNNKYLDWMCQQAVDYALEKIIESVKCFHKNVNRLNQNNVVKIFDNTDLTLLDTLDMSKIKSAPKDINSYDGVSVLKAICEYFEEEVPKTTSRVKLYEDDKWLVVSPLTHEASCKYGIHSAWCVSTSNKDYYNRYTKDGLLVFFLDKKGTHPVKANANSYKIAVNIKFDEPNPMDWHWYTMDDNRVDAALMVNLLPKKLIDVTSAYFKEFTDELNKRYIIDENILEENSLIIYKPKDGEYILFLDLHDWEPTLVKKATKFLKNFTQNTDSIESQIINSRNTGLPYIHISKNIATLPDIDTGTVSWSMAKYAEREGNLIKLSSVKEHLLTRYIQRDVVEAISNADQYDVNNFWESYSDMFNKAKISDYNYVSISQLAVGDVIEHGRDYPRKKLTVVRVSDKSVLLDNGSRIAKTSSSKKRFTEDLKIVDDTVRTESIWKRKRII